ncbi:MAG: hypothetical protein WC619_04850 [Patescibacteria group bacterium]
MNDLDSLSGLDQKLSAILAILIYYGESKKDGDKIEVILSKTGLKAGEIAKVTNKSLAAVQKTLQRAGKN